MITEQQLMPIGKFLKTHALKGELNMYIDIDSDFLSEGYPLVVRLDGIFVPFYVATARPKATFTMLVRLDGVSSEEEARKFVNHEVYALRSDLAEFLGCDEEELEDDIENLVGYKAFADDGKPIGTVEDIDDSTENVLLIISRDDGDTIYVPAADEFITAVDDDARTVTLSLPEGLVDLNKKNEQ